jgi:two-component system NarL family sensor kinase
MPSESIIMQSQSINITTLLLATTFLIMLMALFILLIIFGYKKRQIAFLEKISIIEQNYEKSLLSSKLEIQELTFQHISSEIHDNITLSLTLVKLQLHTLDCSSLQLTKDKADSCIKLLSKSISDLSDISRSLNSDIIFQHGLLHALEEELERIRQADRFKLEYELNGAPVYFDAKKDLLIFRIIQEAFNNIIKHANANLVKLILNYENDLLQILICDNGCGFDLNFKSKKTAGLKNMKNRIELLNGKMEVISHLGEGSILSFKIPVIEE